MRESGNPQQENDREEDNKDYTDGFPDPGPYITDYPEEEPQASEFI